MKDTDLMKDRVWRARHIQAYLGVCSKTAYSIIRRAIKTKSFPVFVMEGGRNYLIPRDRFLDWFEGGGMYETFYNEAQE